MTCEQSHNSFVGRVSQ